MVDVYRLLARRVGTDLADELANELREWHDAMVRHERLAGAGCDRDDECPHVEAVELWARARKVFGREATSLRYLQQSARG
jgi:hypothetical protein